MTDKRLTRVKPCADCPTLVTAKATRCHPRNLHRITNDPEMRRKRAEATARHARENPSKAREMARKAAASRMANPVQAQPMRDRMREIQPLSCTPEKLAARDHAARRAKVIAKQMAWCPDEYRAEYRRLIHTKRIRAVDARQMILEMVAADKIKAKAELSPFERQERALRNGAGLQDNVPVTRHSLAATELRQKLA